MRADYDRAMIACSNCNTPISEAAIACPKCGHPNRKPVALFKILFLVSLALTLAAVAYTSVRVVIAAQADARFEHEWNAWDRIQTRLEKEGKPLSESREWVEADARSTA